MTFTAHFYKKGQALGWSFSTSAKSHGEAVAKLAPLIMEFKSWEWMNIKVKQAVAGGQLKRKKRGVI